MNPGHRVNFVLRDVGVRGSNADLGARGVPPRSSSVTTTTGSREQVELLALVRGIGVTSAQLRALLELSPGVRQAVADLVEHTARTEA
jgi:hypothetical protein